MLLYTFAQADIDLMATNGGVTGTINGSPVVLGSKINTGDTVIFTAPSGKMFRVTTAGAVELFLRSNAAYYRFTLSDKGRSGTIDTSTIPELCNYFRCTTVPFVENPLYTFTADDITAINLGGSLTKNGSAVTTGTTISEVMFYY